MAIGSQSHAEMTAGAQLLLEKKAAEVVLRPARPSESPKVLPVPSPRSSGRGSAGAAAADFYISEHVSSDGVAVGRESAVRHDGLGAMRGFVFVLGMYLVMGVMALSGLMLWHWLR